MQKWQHCKLVGNHVTYLGAAGVFENKRDARLSTRAAFSRLEDEGWQLVNVVPNPDAKAEADFIYFFRRPAPMEE